MQHNHGRLGNQIFYFCTGYVIAKRLGRTLYVPYNQAEERDFNVMRRMLWTTEIFPRLRPLYTIFEQSSISQTVVPFAYNQTNQPACCLYEDPMKFAHHRAKFLLLDIKFAQNIRFIEDYLAEIAELLTFAEDVRNQGKSAVRRLTFGYANAMCVHIRMKDFVTLNVSTDAGSTIRITRQIARRKSIADNLELDEEGKRRYIADISTFSEGVDLFVASQVCGAFFISAATSTFGWWLAFFTNNQRAIYYMDDKRSMWDKTPGEHLFL
ncbi:hypothetical protein ANCDUO_13408 [Ancylostoma duodenale]|uniref:L-Fucosyltransferase n=1 Tax=Ancylostoma duodenale TaxID=51022 RepID=A0A0C2GH67_9BILA|nr:hypothetical protein ANCDUO_13408 [Ancylostoma duodenale]